MSSDYHFLVPESFHTKFDSDLYRNDIDLQYSHIFILLRDGLGVSGFVNVHSVGRTD